jgi:2-C-methyl-D-erythritol 4-phosphate cytidylyltransferase
MLLVNTPDPQLRVALIVVAAGTGQRFGDARNKIFAPLNGEPMVLTSLRCFTDRPDITQRLLVVSEADRPTFETEFAPALAEMDVTLVTGGATRTDSVRNALSQVDISCDLIAIHDAARPCAPPTAIDAVLSAAANTGAAILASPLHGTIKHTDSELAITKTLCREGLYQAHTPQVFERDLLLQAYATDASATDDADLVQQLGHTVQIVPDDPTNLKITTPADLVLAQAILSTR